MSVFRSLASLKSLNGTFKGQFKNHPVNWVLVGALLVLLMVRLPYEVHTLATSVPMRIVWVVSAIAILSSYGWIAGILFALLFIVLLTDVHIEGMTNNDSTQKDISGSSNTHDPVHDALEKVKTKSASSSSLPPPSTSSEKETPIETKVADANEQGTMSQTDKDRAMKISSHINSKDDSIVSQMKKEKEIAKAHPDAEGFTPMISFRGGGTLAGSSF